MFNVFIEARMSNFNAFESFFIDSLRRFPMKANTLRPTDAFQHTISIKGTLISGYYLFCVYVCVVKCPYFCFQANKLSIKYNAYQLTTT